MSRFLAIATLAALLAGTAHAATDKRDLDQAQLTNMAKVIQIKGYNCRAANSGRVMKETHLGVEFRVMCNNDALRYKVTLTPSNDFIVQPD